MTAKPNVVLICVDQWRGDCLSVDGHPVVHTPYLDQLALDGVPLQPAPIRPRPPASRRARALFTGLSPAHARPRRLSGRRPLGLPGHAGGRVHPARLPDPGHRQDARLPRALADRASRTSSCTTATCTMPAAQHASWTRWTTTSPGCAQQLGRDADYFDHGVNCNSYVARPWDKDEYLHPTNFVITPGHRLPAPARPAQALLPLPVASTARTRPTTRPPGPSSSTCTREMPDAPVGDWVELLASPMPTRYRPDACVRRMRPARAAARPGGLLRPHDAHRPPDQPLSRAPGRVRPARQHLLSASPPTTARCWATTTSFARPIPTKARPACR